MDMSEFHDLRHKVNVAATKIDAELGAARASNPPVDGNPHVQAAHAALGDLDKALIALDAWAKAQESPPELPPVTTPGAPITPGPGGSVGTVYKSGTNTGAVRWVGFENTIYSVVAGSAGQLSWTVSSGGSKCYVSRDPAVPTDSSLWGAGASPEITVAVGDVIYMRFEGATQQGCTVSIPR